MAGDTTDDPIAQQCYLLELPAELRDKISGLVVVINMPGFVALSRTKQRRSMIAPALMRTNRQLRVETQPLYYGLSIFRFDTDRFDDRQAFQSWIISIRDRARLITHLELNICAKHETTLKLHRAPRAPLQFQWSNDEDAEFCWQYWLEKDGSEMVEALKTKATGEGLSEQDRINLVKSWDAYRLEM